MIVVMDPHMHVIDRLQAVVQRSDLDAVSLQSDDGACLRPLSFGENLHRPCVHLARLRSPPIALVSEEDKHAQE